MTIDLVFLHGVGGSADTWAPQVAHFQDRFPVLAWNAPGYGGTQMLSELSFSGIAERLFEDISELDFTEVVLVGHSFGGMIAQQFVKDHPQVVNGVVLSSTSPAFGNPDGDFQKTFVADRTRPLDEGRSMADMAREVASRLLGSRPCAGALKAAETAMGQVPETTYRATVSLLTTFDLRDNLARIPVPVLVIAGEEDRMAPPDMMQRMASRIPHARFEVMPTTGHLAPMENPSLFNQLIDDFLGELDDRATANGEPQFNQ